MGVFGMHFDDPRVDKDGNLQPEILQKLHNQVGETPFIREVSIKELLSFIETEPKLKSRTDEEFLLRFLRAKNFNVEKAFHCLKNYYRNRIRYPEIFSQMYPENFTHLLHFNPFLFLKKLDPNGQPVVIFKAGAYDPSAMPMEVCVQAAVMGAEMLHSDPIAQLKGFVFVIDCAGSGFKHVKANPPHKVRRYIVFSQNWIPLKLKAVHVINESPIVDIAFTIVKPFLSKKIKDRIHFHGCDWKSLHTFIPPEILPEEYGGTHPAINMKPLVDLFVSYNQKFIEENKYGFSEE